MSVGVCGSRRPLAAFVSLLILTLGVTSGLGQSSHKAPPALLPSPPAKPTPPPDAKPYDGQLIRLAEILGTLSYLGTLCGDTDAGQWRTRMQALLEAEGVPPLRKERLAGAFNRGIQGYGLSYRTCTPNARLIIERFLNEGARIARDVENRYGAS